MRVAVLGLLAIVACRDVSAPEPVVNGLPHTVAMAIVGTYQQTHWNGQVLPALIAGGGMDCTVSGCVPNGGETRLVAGSIAINANGTWTRGDVGRTTYTDAGRNVEWSASISGTYTGSIASGPIVLTFFYPCGPAATCSVTSTISTADAGTTLAGTWGSDVYRYAR